MANLDFLSHICSSFG